MQILCVIVTDEKGHRDAQLTLNPAGGDLTVVFKMNAKSCRAVAEQLAHTAEELDSLIVSPFGSPLCGVCSGTLKGFNRVAVDRDGKLVHYGWGGEGSWYECKRPPENGRDKANE